MTPMRDHEFLFSVSRSPYALVGLLESYRFLQQRDWVASAARTPRGSFDASLLYSTERLQRMVSADLPG